MTWWYAGFWHVSCDGEAVPGAQSEGPGSWNDSTHATSGPWHEGVSAWTRNRKDGPEVKHTRKLSPYLLLVNSQERGKELRRFQNLTYTVPNNKINFVRSMRVKRDLSALCHLRYRTNLCLLLRIMLSYRLILCLPFLKFIFNILFWSIFFNFIFFLSYIWVIQYHVSLRCAT